MSSKQWSVRDSLSTHRHRERKKMVSIWHVYGNQESFYGHTHTHTHTHTHMVDRLNIHNHHVIEWLHGSLETCTALMGDLLILIDYKNPIKISRRLFNRLHITPLTGSWRMLWGNDSKKLTHTHTLSSLWCIVCTKTLSACMPSDYLKGMLRLRLQSYE